MLQGTGSGALAPGLRKGKVYISSAHEEETFFAVGL